MKPVPFLAAAFALTLQFSEGAEFKIGAHTFTLPEGFTVEKVAGPGLIDRPIVADFDERGRLYVAESSGSNDPVNKQLIDKPHRIVRLEDSNGDGVFDKSQVFADKMMFPEGAMWLDGSLYVSAPPIIWKLTDSDDDGVADKREEWLDAKTLTGCANDLHGPYLGPDGWIYWCKGAFAKQTYERPGEVAFETRAAHIFRRRPEGGPVEPVMTGGMDNPVDVTFTPEGERIFTTTFFQHPGGGNRDGLVHAIYGGVYGKVHDVIDGHPRTGELMPVLTHLGPAAPAGLTRYESEIFGVEYRDNLFAALFNLHKVTRHILKSAGATYRTEDSDFLVSDNTDFHPTDVTEDADGSLLVIDTGGWYKLCCPTSQLWKPDVLGAIYRIRRVGAPKVADPRGLKIDWTRAKPDELAEFLGDPRPAVARRAVHFIRNHRETAGGLVEVLVEGKGTQRQQLNAVWALASNKDQKLVLLDRVLEETNSPSVKHAALHALSVSPRQARASLDRITELLAENEPPQVRRAAAEVLGRTRAGSAVPHLLRAAGRLKPAPGKSVPDRVEEHSIIYALIEINSPERTRAGLIDTNSFVTRAALIALDQMSPDALQPSDVLPFLDSDEALLKETANWIIAHRSDWGAELASYFKARLGEANLTRAERQQIESQLIVHARSAAIQGLVADIASDHIVSDDLTRHVAFQVIREARLKEVPATWISAVVSSMNTPGSAQVVNAALAASRFPFKEMPFELKSSLLKIVQSGALPNPARLEALASIANGLELDDDLFQYLRAQLKAEAAPPDRRFAITALARAALSERQLRALLPNLQESNPLDFTQLLDVYEKSPNESLGYELISAVKESRSLSSLAGDQLQRVFAKYPEPVRAQARELHAAINADAVQQRARLEELLPKLQGGDIRRGQAIFNSTRAACSSCHAIGYLGGDLGPDLTKIGQVRTERDLLEAILYPSASFVRSFEPITIATRTDDLFSGVLRNDAPDEVILGTGPGAQVRIARADITEMRPGKISVMPQGLDGQLTIQELADLLAFLKATRW